MKTGYFKKILIGTALALMTSFAYGQMTGPGDPGGEPDPGDPPVGGNAPLSGGVSIILTLGLAYGGKKVVELVNKDHAKDDK